MIAWPWKKKPAPHRRPRPETVMDLLMPAISMWAAELGVDYARVDECVVFSRVIGRVTDELLVAVWDTDRSGARVRQLLREAMGATTSDGYVP